MQHSIFHVHTYRCTHMHDDKKEWEYVEKAIELGATEIWFTDHAPFPGNPFNDRMMMDELPDYVAQIQKLKEQYRGQIDVKLGLEIEYLPEYYEYYEELRDSGNYDVLLLGPHFARMEDGSYTFDAVDKSNEARILAKGMMEGMESGFFKVVAHPDQIFRRQKAWDEESDRLTNEIMQCAVRTGVILERNISNMIGKKKKRAYRAEFWNKLPEGVQTIYGVDAHSVAELAENYLAQRIQIL